MLEKVKINYLFTFLIFFAFFIKLNEVGVDLKNKILITSTLDFSWLSDLIERLLHGYIVGRDFIFTYGPLFQFIYGFPSLIFKLPSYISIALTPLMSILVVLLLLISFSKLIIKEKGKQLIFTIYMLFFMGIISFDEMSLIGLVKTLLLFIYSVLLSKFLLNDIKLTIKKLIISALPTLFGLFSYEIFLYCFLISVLFSFYNTAVLSNRKLQGMIFSLLYLFLIIFIQVNVSILFTGNLNYLTYSLDTVKNYHYIMSTDWMFNQYHLLPFPVILLILLIYSVRNESISLFHKNIFLILTLSSMIQFKTALTRSDPGHLFFSFYPSIFTIFTILFFLIKIRQYFIFLALILFMYIPIKPFFGNLSLENVGYVGKIIRDKYNFFDIYKLPSNYYFDQNDFNFFSNFISSNKGKVFIYPHDNFILNIYNTTYNSLPLQFYQYSSSIVEKEAVRRFDKNPPKYIILGIDELGAFALDGIPNFTRNPLFSKWLIQNYSIFKHGESYLILFYHPDKLPNKTPISSESALNSNRNECSLYELRANINYKGNLLSKIIERLIKAPIYTLDYIYYPHITIRLPYTQSDTNYLIFNHYNNINEIEKIFERKINFDKFYINNEFSKKIRVIKEQPLTKTKTIFNYTNSQINIKCFN